MHDPYSIDPTSAPYAGGGVSALLSSLAPTTRIKYLPNRGNGGDALINAGFYDLADKIGLKYDVVGLQADLQASDTVVIAGGGALVPEYRFAPTVRHLSDTVGTLILLPQTVREQDELLTALGANVHLFTRERPSYEYCKRVATKANVAFDHDMAFHIDWDALKRRKGFSGFRLNPRNVANLALLVALQGRAKRTKRLRAFRVGAESAVPGRGRYRSDVSKLCAFGTATKAQSFFSASRMVQTVGKFEEIHTDRLHVAIAAGLLGKRTFLYDNSYYKCRAVHAASLRDYPNVVMVPPRET